MEIIKLLASLWDGDVSNIIANLNIGSNPPPQEIASNIEIRKVALEQVEKIQQHNNSLEAIYRRVSAGITDTLRVSNDFNKIPHSVIGNLFIQIEQLSGAFTSYIELLAPFVRIFKENFAFLVYDLIEKFIFETPFYSYLDKNGTIGMFNSTANELYFNVGRILSNVTNGTSLNGRDLEDVMIENLIAFDSLENYWRAFKVADFTPTLPQVNSL